MSNLIERLREWANYDELSAELVADLSTAADEVERLRSLYERLWSALEMVRDADNDCRLDGQPHMPGPARNKIDDALGLVSSKGAQPT